MRKIFYILLLLTGTFFSCADDHQVEQKKDVAPPPQKPITRAYGYILDDYVIERDTVRSGDSFGQILFNQGIGYGTIQKVTDSVKDIFDTRLIDVGKPYVLLKSKDSLELPKVFIYEKNLVDYVAISLADTIMAKASKKPVKIVEKTASGVINDNLSSTFDDLGLNVLVSYAIADIYAWTIDFFHLYPGDRFKVVYTQEYVNDTVPVSNIRIKASWFEHNGNPIYAFGFEKDTIMGIDFYDEEANNLRRAFLKGPLKFGRISSKYNLQRRIAYYGNKVRPHKGTDFAGAIGTPIMATADGTVTKSEYRGGNGNYVKIRHNATYETQYLHMRKRAVKRGDYVKQGDVIGYIGMTGNTGGPHVCYRFWKNGKQVDPFKQALPDAEPLADSLQPKYFEFITPLKDKLDALTFDQVIL
ncbi:MAG: peptidoglycan DD-metalloendopeptidase family protein [Leeuwenhoekiella sp.]